MARGRGAAALLGGDERAADQGAVRPALGRHRAGSVWRRTGGRCGGAQRPRVQLRVNASGAALDAVSPCHCRGSRRRPELAPSQQTPRRRRSPNGPGRCTSARCSSSAHSPTSARALSPPVPATAGPTSGRGMPRRRRSPTRRPATVPEARRVTRFLLGLGLEQAARFHGDGSPVPGRAAQGDAIGWVAAASRAAGLIGSARHAARILAGGGSVPWRDRADYWEGEPGDYLGNALASSPMGLRTRIYLGKSARRLVRRLGDPDSGLDSAAAWGVRPFPHPGLYPAIRRSLRALVGQAHPLRDHARRRLARRRGPLVRSDRLDRVVARGARRAARGAATDASAAALGDAGGRPAGARRRRDRHPPLDHPPRLVPRLRDPGPAGTLAKPNCINFSTQ